MIQALRYLPRSGNLEIKENNGRRVLESAKTINDFSIKDSDVSGESTFIQTIFTAVKGENPSSTIKSCNFNFRLGVFTVDGRVITPDDGLTGETSEVRDFANVVFTPENRVVYDANKPVEYQMESKPFRRIEDRNGVPTLITGTEPVPKTRKVRVKNEDGSPAFDENGKPLFTREKIKKA